MSAELSIIIVNWNGRELLKSCLRHLAAHAPGIAHEIVVVDNASDDGSVGWLRSDEARALARRATDLRVIENAENLGFGRANNQAIAQTRAPMLLLLNSDADVTEGAIDALVAVLRSDARIGAVGPRLLNTDGTLQHSVWRVPPTPWEILLAGSGVWRLIPKRVRGPLLLGGHWDHDERRDVPMIFGAAVLARREMVEEVGGFDESFHMYSEDMEWCLRMARAGWRLVFEPSAVVVHHGGMSALRRWTSSEKRLVQLDTFFQFQQRCLPRHHVVANQLASCFVAWGQLTARRLFGRPTEEVELVLRAQREHLRRALHGGPAART